jgi:hypothetical protein
MHMSVRPLTCGMPKPLQFPNWRCGLAKFNSVRHIGFAAVWVCLGVLLLASQGRGDGVTFNSPTGDLGSAMHTYTLDGVSIAATGFNGGDLWGKDAGPGEQGVGLAGDPSGQHEIFAIAGSPQDYIQLNLLNLITAGFTNFEFAMNSTTAGETWQVTACATAGTPGSGPCTANGSTIIGTTETLMMLPGNFGASDPILDISSNKGNVLLSQIAATAPSVPEPSSLGLLLVGMLALAATMTLKRRMAEQA